LQTGGIFDDNLSVQQMLECFSPQGCEGGSPEEACLWLEKTGTVLGTNRSNPFQQGNGSFVDGKCQVVHQGWRVGVEKGTVRSLVEFIPEEGYDEGILNENILNMKRALMNNGPFYCAMTVYDDFFEYDGLGVYVRHPGATEVGGHAIEVVGYCEKGVDTRKNFKKSYWICRNSWGKDWPLASAMVGYFTIEMGVNMCGIESRCGMATPSVEGKMAKSDVAVDLDELRYTDIQNYLR